MFMNKFKNGGDNSIYHPEEIAGVIARYLETNNRYNTPENCEKMLIEYMYQLYAVCQNEYNADYFRVFYVALSDFIDEYLYHAGINEANYLLYGEK